MKFIHNDEKYENYVGCNLMQNLEKISIQKNVTMQKLKFLISNVDVNKKLKEKCSQREKAHKACRVRNKKYNNLRKST